MVAVWMKGFLLLTICCLPAALAEDHFTICVRNFNPEEYAPPLYYCNKFAEGLAASGIHLKCIEGESRLHCLTKVANSEADVTFTMYPEDIVIAGKYFRDQIVVLGEVHKPGYLEGIKDKLVAVVKTSSSISTLADLKGKRACLPNFELRSKEIENPMGPNSATRTIIGLLVESKLMHLKCDKELNQLDREMDSLSSFFGPSCVPGMWGFDNSSETYLKKKYGGKLCRACLNKTKCATKPSTVYSIEEEDPVKCLKHGGDVAWTMLSKLKHGFQEVNDSKEYRILCPDGATEDLDLSEAPFKTCNWGGKPWPVFLARKSLGSVKRDSMINQLKITLRSTDSGAVNFTDKTFTEQIKYEDGLFEIPMTTPQDYVQKNGFSFIYMSPACNETENIRMCVINDLEAQKCYNIKRALSGQRQTALELSCVMGKSLVNCVNMLKSGQVDMVLVDAGLASLAEKTSDFKVVMTGFEPSLVYHIKAVVKDKSEIRFIDDLKGKRSCHVSHGENDFGWYMPIHILQEQGMIPRDLCSLEKLLQSFFSESCIYGDQLPQNDTVWGNPTKLCKACSDENANMSKCPTANVEAELSPDNAVISCLDNDQADVVFIHQYASADPFDFHGKGYRLLCPWNSSVDTHSHPDCNWGNVTSRRFLLMSTNKKKYQVDDVAFLLDTIIKLGNVSDALVKPTGSYYGSHNIIFNDGVTYFESQSKYIAANQDEKDNQKTAEKVVKCSNNINFPPAPLTGGSEGVIAKSHIMLINLIVLVIYIFLH